MRLSSLTLIRTLQRIPRQAYEQGGIPSTKTHEFLVFSWVVTVELVIAYWSFFPLKIVKGILRIQDYFRRVSEAFLFVLFYLPNLASATILRANSALFVCPSFLFPRSNFY